MKNIYSHALLLAILLISALCASAQTKPAPLFARNSGDWNDYENWTTDASGLVWTNQEKLVPGKRGTAASKNTSNCSVTINANKRMTLELPAAAPDPLADDIVIDTLTVNGDLTIHRPTGYTTQKITIKKLLGRGIFRINDKSMLHFDYTVDAGIVTATNLFDMSQFEGTIVFNNDTGNESEFGNPLASIPGYDQMPLPASTLEAGALKLTTNYIINGDLVIKPGAVFTIKDGVTITVKGDVINDGTIQSDATGTTGSTLVLYGNIENRGTLNLFGELNSSGVLVNDRANVVTKFVGGKDTEVIFDGTLNNFFRILVDKDNNAKVSVYSTGSAQLVLAAAIADNPGTNYKDMPFVIERGVLDLGAGVNITGALPWWSAMGVNTGKPEITGLASTKGSIYIPEGASLSISGANISLGETNPLFIAGSLIINSGSFTSGKPGIFYTYPIRINDDGTSYVDNTSLNPSRMTLNGGTLTTSRNVCLYSGVKPRPTIHFQYGGEFNYTKEASTWDDEAEFTNKTVYLGAGSQFIMHDGTLVIGKNAIGSSKSRTVGGINAQIIMHDMESGQMLPSLIDGGLIKVTGSPIIAMMKSCNDVTVETGANLTLVPLASSETTIVVNGDMTIKGTMTPNNHLKIGGNFTVDGGTYNTASNYDITFVGSDHSKYNATNVVWRSVIVEKEQNRKATVGKDKILKVANKIEVNSGRLGCNDQVMSGGSLVTESGTVQIVGNTSFSDHTEGLKGLEDVNLVLSTAGSLPSLTTDIVLNSVQFTANVKFQLNYNNLKIKNYPTGGSWGVNCGFEVPSTNTVAAHGLSLPVPQTVNSNLLFPMIVNGKYTYVQVLFNEAKLGRSAYVSVVPVDSKHPALYSDAAFKNYWIIKCSYEDFYVPNNFDLFKCLNFNLSDDFGDSTNKRRHIFFTAEGSKRGAEFDYTKAENWSWIRYKNTWFEAGKPISFNTENGGSRLLSGDYTAGKSSDADNNYCYYSQDNDSRIWQNSMWYRKKTGENFESGYKKGSDIETSSEVSVDHEVTFNATSGTYNAGVVTINNKLIIKETSAGYLNAVSLSGEGTLQYDVNATSGDVKFISAKHNDFCNSTVATFVLNMEGNKSRTFNLSQINEFPNLKIIGSGTLTIPDNSSIKVRGNLTVGAGVTLNCGNNTKVVVEGDIIVENGGTLNIAKGSQELRVEGNIINNGTIGAGGCPVYLWNGVTNNGTMDFAGAVYFWGTSGLESNVLVNGSSNIAGLGDYISISKSASDCTIEFDVNVKTHGSDAAVVDIVTGVLAIESSGTTQLRQYTTATSADFNIPTSGSLNVNKGTTNIIITGSDKSVYNAGKLSVSNATLNVILDGATSGADDYYRGIVYSTNTKITLSSATVNTMYITPSTQGSIIELQTSGTTNINCKKGVNMSGYYGIFDIRDGNVKMDAGTSVNISSAVGSDVPSLYFAPSTYKVDPTVTFNVDAETDKASDKAFSITALSPLGTLVINTNYAKILDDEMSVLGKLQINTGKEFDANSLGVTLGGDFVVGGTYTPGTDQTITFNGSSEQHIKLEGVQATDTLTLCNMVTASLDATNGICVDRNVALSGDLTVEKGRVTIGNSYMLLAKENATVNYGTVVAGNGSLSMGNATSTEPKSLFCEGTISNLIINNKYGINTVLQQAEPILISNSLTLKLGVYDIAGNLIDLLGTAVITDGGSNNTFDVHRMIATNGSFTDNGVKIHWAKDEIKGENKDGDGKPLVIPLGKKGTVYTPVTFSNVRASVAGYLCISTNDEMHPEIYLAINYAEHPYYENNKNKTALPYYWYFVCKSLQTKSVTGDGDSYIEFSYPCNKENYVSAFYYSSDPMPWHVGENATAISDGRIKIKFPTTNWSKFSGQYTACESGLKINNRGVCTAEVSGNWDEKIWRHKEAVLESDGNGGTKIGTKESAELVNFVPYAAAIIDNGVTVTLGKDDAVAGSTNSDHNAKYVQIQPTGELIIKKDAKNNNFTSVHGTGRLVVNSDVCIPTGRYGEFCGIGGGTMVYDGEYSASEGYNVFEIASAYNVEFKGTGKRILRQDIDAKALGKVAVKGPEVVFQNGCDLKIESHIFSTYNDKATYDSNHETDHAGSVLRLESGSVSGDGYFSLNECEYTQRYISYVSVYSTTYEVESQSKIASSVWTASDFPTIPGLIVNNSNGVEIGCNNNGLTGNNGLSLKKLKLETGILTIGDNNKLTIVKQGSLIGGSETSFIDGMIAAYPQSGVTTTYPLGDVGDRNYYAPTPIVPLYDQSGSNPWILGYTHKNPATGDPVPVHSHDKVMLNEYWYVEAPSAGDKAMITFSWNAQSGQSFEKYNTLERSIKGTPNSDWEPISFGFYNGNGTVGSIKSVEHQVGSGGSGYYYALSCANENKDFVWVGRTSTVWDYEDNWKYRKVPGSQGNVTINTVSNNNYPNVNTEANMKTLTVSDGAKIEFGRNSEVNINDWVVNHGMVTISGGTNYANGTITNDGTVKVTGGTITAKDALTNNLGKTMEISGGTVITKATVTNNGNMPINNGGRAIAEGDIINAGAITLEGHNSLIKATGTNLTNTGTFNVNFKPEANPNLYYTSANTTGNFVANRTFDIKKLYYTGSATTERSVTDIGVVSAGDYVYRIDPNFGFDAAKNSGHSYTVIENKSSFSGSFQGSRNDGNIISSAVVLGFTNANDNGRKTIKQTGTLTKAETVSYDMAPSPDGWMWLNQPFPFTINLSAISYDKDQAFGTLYARSGAKEGSEGQFLTYNNASNVALNGFNKLAPFQSFCVGNRSLQGEANLRVTIAPSMASEAAELKSSSIEHDVLRIEARANGYSDEMALVFRDGGQSYYFDFDSEKRINSSGMPSLSVIKEETKCAVGYYPQLSEISEENVFPLAIDGNKNDLTLVFTNVDGFDSTKDIYIRDTRFESGKGTNIRESSYYVVEEPETLQSGELELVFTEAKSVGNEEGQSTDLQQSNNAPIRINAHDNQVVVEVAEVKTDATVAIYDMFGQLVTRKAISDTTTTIKVSYNSIFVVEVVNGGNKSSKKVLLKR